MSKSSKMSRNKRTDSKKQKLAKQRALTEQNRMRKMKYNIRMNPRDRQLLEALWHRWPSEVNK